MLSRDVGAASGGAGFTLVELMVATALLMIVMAAAVTGIVEAQRGINTVSAREADANRAQALVNQVSRQVAAASGAAVSGCSGQCTELWLYDETPPMDWPYKCTVWVFDGSSSPGQLDVFATNASVVVAAATPTLTQISAAASMRAQLKGVSAPSGSSGIFQVFSGYPGLVDINFLVQYYTSSGQSDTQGASAPSQVETEADDVNVSSSSGLAPLSPSNPSTNCY